MLVLSRKVDEQIMIGNDITLTVVRIDGNRVRIGVNAPREMRILRGEIASKEAASRGDDVPEPPCEMDVFAHPQPLAASASIQHPSRHDSGEMPSPRVDPGEDPKLFAGKCRADGTGLTLSRDRSHESIAAPLAAFVSAT